MAKGKAIQVTVVGEGEGSIGDGGWPRERRYKRWSLVKGKTEQVTVDWPMVEWRR